MTQGLPAVGHPPRHGWAPGAIDNKPLSSGKWPCGGEVEARRGAWPAAGHSRGVDLHRAGGAACADEGHHHSQGKSEVRSRKAPEGAVCSPGSAAAPPRRQRGSSLNYPPCPGKAAGAGQRWAHLFGVGREHPCLSASAPGATPSRLWALAQVFPRPDVSAASSRRLIQQKQA